MTFGIPSVTTSVLFRGAMLLEVNRMYICIAFKSVRLNMKVAPRIASCLPVCVISPSKLRGGADNVEFSWSAGNVEFRWSNTLGGADNVEFMKRDGVGNVEFRWSNALGGVDNVEFMKRCGADNVEFCWSLRTIITWSLDARSVATTEGSNVISHELSARLGSKSGLPSPQSVRSGGGTVVSMIFLISSSFGLNFSSKPATTVSRC